MTAKGKPHTESLVCVGESCESVAMCSRTEFHSSVDKTGFCTTRYALRPVRKRSIMADTMIQQEEDTISLELHVRVLAQDESRL